MYSMPSKMWGGEVGRREHCDEEHTDPHTFHQSVSQPAGRLCGGLAREDADRAIPRFNRRPPTHDADADAHADADKLGVRAASYGLAQALPVKECVHRFMRGTCCRGCKEAQNRRLPIVLVLALMELK